MLQHWKWKTTKAGSTKRTRFGLEFFFFFRIAIQKSHNNGLCSVFIERGMLQQSRHRLYVGYRNRSDSELHNSARNWMCIRAYRLTNLYMCARCVLLCFCISTATATKKKWINGYVWPKHYIVCNRIETHVIQFVGLYHILCDDNARHSIVVMYVWVRVCR